MSMQMVVLCAALSLAATAARAGEAAPVHVWEDAITLPTHLWQEDIHPVFQELEGSIYYPWPRQDHLLREVVQKSYRTLNLENEYLRVTCIPELGGRIHSVFNKTTGGEMFHRNDHIKPALIAMRGAWIAGGIEWNAGPQGHTVFMMEPVQSALQENPDGSATLIVGTTEKTFRTRWVVRLTLRPGRAFLEEDIRLINPTDGVQPYYFWNNTAFPNNPGTRFIYPMTLGTDHAGTTFFRWPVNEGRDLTWLKNYDTMTSIFGYKVGFDFFGAYEVDEDRGIVSFTNHHEVPGKKAWTWGKDDFGIVSQMSLSDDGPDRSQYIEVQSGPLRTQADYGMMRPRQEIAWREWWYPVHGLGDGFEYATRDIAAQAYHREEALELRLLATGSFPDARCTLSAAGTVLLDTEVALSPAKPAVITLAPAPEGPVRVSVVSPAQGALLDYTTPLDIPVIDPPSLEKRPARPDGQPTADELFAEAFLKDSQSDPDGARTGYEKVLELDPEHADARCALAVLDNESARFAEAAEHARIAVARDPGNGAAWHQLGVASLGLGEYEEAARAGWKAVRCAGTEALGLELAGRAAMWRRDYGTASDILARAVRTVPENSTLRDAWLASRFNLGDRDALLADIEAAAMADPTDLFAAALGPLVRWNTAPSENSANAELDTLPAALAAPGGDPAFNTLEAAAFLLGMDLPRPALELLQAAEQSDVFRDAGPYPLYCMAYCRTRLNARVGEDSRALLLAAAAGTNPAAPKPQHPHGAHALVVMRFAVKEAPEDANAHYLLGLTLAGLHRAAEAVPCWERAVALNPMHGLAWRLLGLHRWKKEENLATAETAYRNALAALPNDQMVLRDLTEVLTKQGRRAEALALAEALPEDTFRRYDLALWQAKAYLDEGRNDDCVAFLRDSRFSNWEGVTTPRDIFVGALMARGKQHAEAGNHAGALADFEEALTYPENLGVGQRYKRTDAETCLWAGKALQALGRVEEARAMWTEGAGQITLADPPQVFVTVTKEQDEAVGLCRAALEALR